MTMESRAILKATSSFLYRSHPSTAAHFEAAPPPPP